MPRQAWHDNEPKTASLPVRLRYAGAAGVAFQLPGLRSAMRASASRFTEAQLHLLPVPLDGAGDAFLKIHARRPPEQLAGFGDVGLAVLDVAGTRWVELRRDFLAGNLVDRRDQIQQRDAAAAGDVESFAQRGLALLRAGRAGFAGGEVGVDDVFDVAEITGL